MIILPSAPSLVLGAALTQHLALSLPLPEFHCPDEDSKKRLGRLRNGSQTTICFLGFCKAIVWCDTATRLIRSYQGHGPRSTIPWLSVTGIILSSAGAALNLASAGTLGLQLHSSLIPNTTQYLLHIPVSHQLRPENAGKSHEFTLSPTHTLVTTGPYGIVRHPMYASVLLGLVGSGFFYASSGSPLYGLLNRTLELTRPHLAPERLLPIFGRIGDIGAQFADYVPWEGIAAGLFSVGFAYVAMHLHRTAEMEDEALRARFGKRWRLYQWQVPYKFLPGVL